MKTTARNWCMSRITLSFVLMAFLSAVGIPANAQKERVLNFATVDTKAHPLGQAADYFAERVAQLTDGRVKVQVHYSSALGSARSAIEGVQLGGTIDIATDTMSAFANFVPEFDVTSMPFLFRNYHHFMAVIDGPIGDTLRKAAEKAGFEVLALRPSSARHIMAKKPIRTPADVRGLKIRTLESPVIANTWRTLGAIPTPIAFGEVYMALQTGLVDATETAIPAWLSMSFYEVAPYTTVMNYAFVGGVYVMNPSVFASLREDDRNALKKAMHEASERVFQSYIEADMTAAATAASKGGQLIEGVDMKPFQDAVAPMYRSFTPTLGSEIVEKIRKTPDRKH